MPCSSSRRAAGKPPRAASRPFRISCRAFSRLMAFPGSSLRIFASPCWALRNIMGKTRAGRGRSRAEKAVTHCGVGPGNGIFLNAFHQSEQTAQTIGHIRNTDIQAHGNLLLCVADQPGLEPGRPKRVDAPVRPDALHGGSEQRTGVGQFAHNGPQQLPGQQRGNVFGIPSGGQLPQQLPGAGELRFAVKTAAQA